MQRAKSQMHTPPIEFEITPAILLVQTMVRSEIYVSNLFFPLIEFGYLLK
jgi:hypothetical protein